MVLIILMSLLAFFEIVYYFYYIKKQKQEKIEYFRDIPSDEKPAIVGLMVKGNVDGNDIISTILDLWERGYISVEYRIIDDIQKCIIKDTGKDRFMILMDFENYLLDELFKGESEIVFDDFVNSPKFEIVFKNVGKMINRRVNLKKTHKVSYKRLKNKINFLVNYIVLGFALFFPIIYLISKNFLLSVLVGICINLIFFLLIKAILVKEEKSIEVLLFGISSTIATIFFSVLLIVSLISKYTYLNNQFFEIINIAVSILLILCFFIGDYSKKMKITIIDYVVLLYSIVSIPFGNIIGLCLSIIYFSHRIYLKSPKHSYLSDENEIDKWFALKKFLNEFSYISDRELMEVKIWDKYLIYGISMGVNKKIILEYAKLANIKLINGSILDKCYSESIMF